MFICKTQISSLVINIEIHYKFSSAYINIYFRKLPEVTTGTAIKSSCSLTFAQQVNISSCSYPAFESSDKKLNTKRVTAENANFPTFLTHTISLFTLPCDFNARVLRHRVALFFLSPRRRLETFFPRRGRFPFPFNFLSRNKEIPEGTMGPALGLWLPSSSRGTLRRKRRLAGTSIAFLYYTCIYIYVYTF